MSGLTGKTWLITGTSAGFGQAIAREVLSRGGNVVASARNPEAVAGIAALAPDRVLATRLDVTRPEEVDAAVSASIARFGRIDALVNNAGYGLLAAIEEASDAEVRRQFDVNVFGLAALTRAVLPYMREAGGGTVVNISSTAGVRAFPGSGYYSASKFAVEAISEALSLEGRELGIRVLLVEPGPFRTDFSGRSIALPERALPAYAAAAAMREHSSRLDGTQPGDPARAARIIVETVLAEDPPLRLLLGGGAYARSIQAVRERLADMERSGDVATTADFPPSEQAA